MNIHAQSINELMMSKNVHPFIVEDHLLHNKRTLNHWSKFVLAV